MCICQERPRLAAVTTAPRSVVHPHKGFVISTFRAGEGKVANHTLALKTAQSDTISISLAPSKSEALPNFNRSEKYNPTVCPEVNKIFGE